MERPTNLCKLASLNQEQQYEYLLAALAQWSGINFEPGSYIYDLMRVKSAYQVGTITLDDFEEWDEERIAEIAQEFTQWLNRPVDEEEEPVEAD